MATGFEPKRNTGTPAWSRVVGAQGTLGSQLTVHSAVRRLLGTVELAGARPTRTCRAQNLSSTFPHLLSICDMWSVDV